MKRTLMIITIVTLLFSGKVYGEENKTVSGNSQMTDESEKNPDLILNQTELSEPMKNVQHIDLQQDPKIEHSSLTIEEETRASSPIVNFTDPVLKMAILTNLRLPDVSEVTEEDMTRVINLTLGTANISNLSGLEYAINLTSFDMRTNGVTDFSPIENLSKLEYVSLQGTNVTGQNFPNFSNPSNLVRLDLSKSSVDNTVYDKIVKLTHLTSLYFDSNQKITTIAPLKVLPELTSLRLQFCGVSDFSMLNEFPKLNSLAATGQNIGRNNTPTTIKSTALSYDATNQTVHIPFSIMPDRLTNFDGYQPPFTTSTSGSNTYLDFNDVQLPADRLQIDENGITVSNVTEEDFENIAMISYNARFNNLAGSYEKPDGYVFYAISSGTYLHNFNIDHTPVQTYQIKYDGNGYTTGEVPIDLSEYLEDAAATALAEGSLVKENANFAGWNTQADGEGMQYQAGDAIQIKGNVTLYAQWSTIPKEVEEIEKPEAGGNGKEEPEKDKHEQTNQITSNEKNTTEKSSIANQKKETTPKKLPETGEQSAFSSLYSSFGVALIILGFVVLRKKRQTNK